jgi:hypothetical protein
MIAYADAARTRFDHAASPSPRNPLGPVPQARTAGWLWRVLANRPRTNFEQVTAPAHKYMHGIDTHYEEV